MSWTTEVSSANDLESEDKAIVWALMYVRKKMNVGH